jgi:hypothetical protein
MNRCSICNKTFTGHGNNPSPFNGEKCCDECNRNYVVPLRIYQITKEPKNAVLFKEDGTVTTITPKDEYFTLDELQSLVEGYIELYPARYLNHYIVCDEEGLLKRRKRNESFRQLTGIGLLGNVLLCPERIFEVPNYE